MAESQFQTVPVPVAGPSYLDRSRPLTSQETRNLYHEVVESGKDNYVLKSFPGQKLFGNPTQPIQHIVDSAMAIGDVSQNGANADFTWQDTTGSAHWEKSGGNLNPNIIAGASPCTSVFTPVIGKEYRIKYTLTGTDPLWKAFFGGVSLSVSNGAFNELITATAATGLVFNSPLSGDDTQIDDVEIIIITDITGADRGSHQMKEVGYRVIDTTLYEVSSAGVHTSRGTITGTDRCIFADDGVNMFITHGGIVNQYENVTNTLVTVSDPDIVGALSVCFINNQFAYTFPTLTVFSDVGDGSSATSLNAVGEESNPDDLVRDYCFDQVLWRAGKRTIALWWNSGVGVPPFERIEGQIMQIGLGATHCMTNTKDWVYFLGSDRQIYKARDGQEQAISTAAIAGAIQKYVSVSDSFCLSFTKDDKTFVIFTFPSANRTWCLNEELGKNGWLELSTGIGTGKYNANSIVEVYDKVLVGGNSDGKLFELDFETFDEGGNPWRRRRVMSSINGDTLGQKGHRVEMSRMEFILEAGVGLTTGQGDDPQIMLEASYDGGRSWATGTWLKIGRLGEFTQLAEWWNMKSFTDLMVRLTTSDPVAFNIYSAVIDLRLAGR